jgi:hypothetical protein
MALEANTFFTGGGSNKIKPKMTGLDYLRKQIPPIAPEVELSTKNNSKPVSK